jgi:hypothetical protein
MPKPQIDLNPFQDLITTWFNNGISAEELRSAFRMSTTLLAQIVRLDGD